MSERLLFLSPGNNLVHLGAVLPRILVEQQVTLEVDNLLAYQISDGLVDQEELRRRVDRADVLLFDIRDGRSVTGILSEARARSRDKTFIPLMGGSMEVMGLCRMGSFNLDRAMASSARRTGPPNFRRIQQITGLVEKLGGLLPVGALRHARNWVRVIRYWTAGGEQNIANMLRLVIREYCGGKGPKPRPPVERPTHSLMHPLQERERAFGSIRAFLEAHPPAPSLPTVALLYYGGMHHEESVVGAGAIARALDGRANVLPIATDGVQTLDALERFLLPPDAPSHSKVDAVISLLWFRLNGGPLGGDPARTIEVMQRLGVPLFVPATLYSRELRRWEESPEGLSPVEAYATVVLPELDGALVPVPVLGLARTDQAGLLVTRAEAIEERVAALVDRVMAWIRLARTPRAERRLALIAYDYPPGPGSAGNASYLDVGRSLAKILARLEAEGFDVGEATDDPLGALLDAGLHNANADSDASWAGERLPLECYAAYFEGLPETVRALVIEAFGPPPGRILVDRLGLRIPGRWFGKVFVGLQPSRRPDHYDHHDPATTHDRELPAHHQYLAFYEYLRWRGLHAVVHVGTHGTAEFTPGKELGLSGGCTPDLLRGSVPQLYIYSVANPSEASIAKRRLQAALVSHHLPDFVPSELYGEYQELLDLLGRLRDPGLAPMTRRHLEEEARRSAKALELPEAGRGLDELEEELQRLKHAAIPMGLHVLGAAKESRSLRNYLVQLFRRRVAGVHVCSLARPDPEGTTLSTWAEAFVSNGKLPPELARELDRKQARDLEQTLVELARAFLAGDELEALVAGLDGRYLSPGLLGDALRSPAVYPVGRNGYAFDPTRIPLPDALERGEALGRSLAHRHRAAHGAWPQTVGLVLWGFETARTGGETIGQLLYLIGARKKEAPGWLPAFEPIPAEELDRPRVDVYLMICGFFRDMFPTLVRDLDQLMCQVAALPEPAEVNPMRSRVAASRELLGEELASARIFGPRPGEYGTGLPDRVERSAWSDETELGQHYELAMAHAYGARLHGSPAREALAGLMSETQVVAQIVDGEEYKIGDLDHYYEFLGGASRAVQNRRGERAECLVGDSAHDIPRIEPVEHEVTRYSVTRLLNPRWIAGMLAHHHHGAKQIEERITNLVGLAGTVGVPSSLFNRVFSRFIEDEEIFRQLCDNNVHATLAMVRRLGEAAQRELWQASAEQRDLLKQRYLGLECEAE